MKNPSTIDAALEMTKQTQQVNSRGLILSFFTISLMGHCVVELHLHTVEFMKLGTYSDTNLNYHFGQIQECKTLILTICEAQNWSNLNLLNFKK